MRAMSNSEECAPSLFVSFSYFFSVSYVPFLLLLKLFFTPGYYIFDDRNHTQATEMRVRKHEEMAMPETMQEPPQNAKTQQGQQAMMRGQWDRRMWGTTERWGSKWHVWAPGMFFFFFPLFYLLTQCFLFFICGLCATVSTCQWHPPLRATARRVVHLPVTGGREHHCHSPLCLLRRRWIPTQPQRQQRCDVVVVVVSSCIRRSPQLRVFPDAGAVTWWGTAGRPMMRNRYGDNGWKQTQWVQTRWILCFSYRLFP